MWRQLVQKPVFFVKILDTCPLQIYIAYAHAVSMQKFRNSSGNLAAATVSTSAILFKVVRGYCRGEPQNIAVVGNVGDS